MDYFHRDALGENDQAEERFRELLLVSEEYDDKVALLHALFGLACVAEAQGRSERAVRLWAASEAMQETAGVRLPPITLSFTDYEGRLTEARAHLGEAAFQEAWVAGESTGEQEVMEYALTATEGPTPYPVPKPEQRTTGKRTSATLTSREQEIAALITRGLTNRRIAGELHLSERTVTTHVGRILKKLKVRSREQVAA